MGFFETISNFLSGPVGNNLANDPQDIKNTKRELNRLGYFNNKTENGFITRELDTGIKSFQKDNDLRVDGKLLPGGETEREVGIQILLAPEPYHPDWAPDGKKLLPPKKLIQMEDNSPFEAQYLNADTEEESKDSIDSDDSSEDDFTPEENSDEEDSEGQSEKNEQGTLPTVNREEIMRQLEEHRQNDKQQKEEAIRILQEKQNEDAGSAVGGFGQSAKNVDATGRMIRNESAPGDQANPVPVENNKDNVFNQFRANLAPREGGIADRSKFSDPGGLTNKGVSQKLLNELNTRSPQLGLPQKPTDLTDDQIDTIFKKEFYERPQIDKLHDVAGENKTKSKLVEHVFDAGITTNPKKVGQWLQESIDETVGTDLKENKNGKNEYDGILGSKTRQALENAVDQNKIKEINERFSDKRIEYFRSLPNYPDNKNGWERRVKDLRG